jgi:Tfp pilus assembly protein PilV
MMANSRHSQKGQTLFELIIAIAIGVVIITGIVILTTLSVGNSTLSKNDASGLRYAQEGIEWIRAERDKSWATTVSKSSSTTQNYCISTLSWSTSGTCTTAQTISGTIYTRTLSLTSHDYDGDSLTETIDAIVLIRWSEGGKQHTSQLATQLTSWKGQQ